MFKNKLSGKLPGILGGLLVIALILYLLWGVLDGLSGPEFFTTLGLLLVVGAIYYLKQMGNVSEKAVSQKIKKDFSSEIQPQVFEVYQRLKAKELEGLFLKVLEDSHGDIDQVKKFAGIAESVGWKAFLENRW